MKRRMIYGSLDGEWTDKELCQWAAGVIGGGFASDARALGMEIDGEIVGVVIWNGFEVNNCIISIASNGSRRWVTREFLFRAFAYPFLQLGLRRVTGVIDEANADALRFARHIGWVEEGIMRKGSLDGKRDAIIFGMLKEECRWIDLKLAAHTVKYSSLGEAA